MAKSRALKWYEDDPLLVGLYALLLPVWGPLWLLGWLMAGAVDGRPSSTPAGDIQPTCRHCGRKP